MDNTVGSLTEEQKSILVGSLLGDGTMRKKKNAHLEINHCFAQKALVDWIFSKFNGLVTTPPKWRKGNGSRKVIPDDLKLDPLSLAVWFMDDGSKSRSSIYLNTQQFSKFEQFKLIDFLRNQFGIDATLNKDKIYYRVRIRTRSVKRFIKLVKEFVLEEFKYKFPSVMTL